MNVRGLVSLSVVACAHAIGGSAAAASWTPVPGAPEVAVDLGSLQLERTRVTVWVRWSGRPAFATGLAAAGVRPPHVNRSAVRTEFDCGRRTARTLALNAYDAAGTPVFMSSVPQPEQPVRGEELGWTYDAVCEAARAGGRF